MQVEKSLQVVSKQARLEEWTRRIMACRNSGMTIRAWCRENGVSEKTYYYWQQRLYREMSEQQRIRQPVFAEVTPSVTAHSGEKAMTIRLSGAEVDVYTGAELTAVEAVLQLLRSC